jgi:hypothetical protein
MHNYLSDYNPYQAAELAPGRDFILERTDRLSPVISKQFLDLFAQVFGRDMSLDQFQRKYLCTPLGYSYHGFMLVDGKVVGACNFIPYVYNCFGVQRLLALSVDTMISKEYRGGPFNLLNMVNQVYQGIKRDSIGFVFGFPNENAYEYTKRVLKWTDIAELDFYALPINIGAIQSKLKWANIFSRLGAGGFVRLSGSRGRDCCGFGIEKVCDKRFEQHRYHHEHRVIDLTVSGGKCIYRYYNEKNDVRTVYIIDVIPFTSACFLEAVRVIHAVVSKHTDLILYVGRLPFGRTGLVRVPPSKRPRRIMMCGKVLDRQLIDERVLQISNWNVNISNFDVR